MEIKIDEHLEWLVGLPSEYDMVVDEDDMTFGPCDVVYPLEYSSERSIRGYASLDVYSLTNGQVSGPYR